MHNITDYIMNTQELTIHTENFLANTWQCAYPLNSTSNKSTSPIRTDILHQGIEDMLLPTYKASSDTTFQLETETTGRPKIRVLDSSGDTLSVDLLLSHNNKIHTVILAKAPQTSINKNRKNMTGSLAGEACRAVPSADPGRNVLLINFLPVETFTKIGSGYKREIVKPHDVIKAMISTELTDVSKVKERVSVVEVRYTFTFDLATIKNDDDLRVALHTTANPIKLVDGALIEFEHYCAEFLSKHP